jgi:hypothetical protein
MHIPGKRVQRTRLIQTEKYVIAVDVDWLMHKGKVYAAMHAA